MAFHTYCWVSACSGRMDVQVGSDDVASAEALSAAHQNVTGPCATL